MVKPAIPGADPSGRLLALVLTALVGSFLFTTFIVHRTSRDVDSLSERIVSRTMPRIERLSAQRGATLEVEVVLSVYIDQDAAGRARTGPALDGWLATLDAVHARHVDGEKLPGEQPLWDELQASVGRFKAAVGRVRALADADDKLGAEVAFTDEVVPAGARVIEAVMRDIEFNAHHGRQLATRIQASRRRTVALSYLLTGFCVALGIAGGLLIVRQARRRQLLVDEHARFLQARADELEQFAGRVAHDIRDPLAAAVMGAELIRDRTEEASTSRVATRVCRSLGRACEITDGLLGFARAGARPDPGARTNVREVIADLASGVGPEAERAGIELHIAPVPPVLVACSSGVYLSILGNLVRNAIKYIGDGPVRRIEIRVIDDEAMVRTEVTDTGPGIPADSLPSLFEPYVRGPTRGQAGLGLGLATVKKLTEGHHGRVGVRSKRGEGSLFWFELPRAGAPWEAASGGDDLGPGHDDVRH